MEQYIKKSAVVAEIKKMKRFAKRKLKETSSKYWQNHFEGCITACGSILFFLDTLEVKEVGEPSNDLEEEIELVKGDYEQVDVAWNNDFDFIARHFYELGLKEQLKNK